MDPNANLKEQLELSQKFLKAWDDEAPVDRLDAYRLGELVEALNDWIRSGGFLPEDWRQKQPEPLPAWEDNSLARWRRTS